MTLTTLSGSASFEESFLEMAEVISVSRLNRLAKEVLDSTIPSLWISGEISNWIVASSGHAYFLLKDKISQVRCVMFRHQLSRLTLMPKDGLQVELRGQVTLYEVRGEFQVNVEALRQAGLGKLFEAFDRLKNQLSQEGLFDENKKRAIPRFPKKVGVITSRNAAVLQDVRSVIHQRMPNLPIILYATSVQGIEAPSEIIRAIQTANQHAQVDVLILCRGGGSIEDLAAFNDEGVVRAMAASMIPTVSGVGHETDITLCDFVADKRAETPTAAAVMVSPDRKLLLQSTNAFAIQLKQALQWQLNNKAQRLDRLAMSLLSPKQQLLNYQAKLLTISEKLSHQMHAQINHLRRLLIEKAIQLQRYLPNTNELLYETEALLMRLNHSVQIKLHAWSAKLAQFNASLLASHPEAVLKKGYAIVRKSDGRIVSTASVLGKGDCIKVQFSQNAIQAIVDRRELS